MTSTTTEINPPRARLIEAREACGEILGHVQAEQRDEALYAMVLDLREKLDSLVKTPVFAAEANGIVEYIRRDDDAARALSDLELHTLMAWTGDWRGLFADAWPDQDVHELLAVE